MLAGDVVRHVGEPIALIAAETKAAARNAAVLVQVRYEPLPDAVELADAIGAHAPRVHDHSPNVMEGVEISRGDTQSLFDTAHLVVASTYTSHRVHQGYIEPRAALAELDDDDRLMITMASQNPFAVRLGLAKLLELPVNMIRVRTVAMGGGFGGKLHLGMAPYAAALCLHTSRPVRVVASRGEELQASNPRENSIVTLESAVDESGRIRARRATVYLDSGAYAYDTPVIASTAALLSCGPYAVDALEARVCPVYTNTMPTGSFRGPSGPQMVYSNEAHLDDIAAQIGMSPLEMRRRNIVRAGDVGATGQVLSDPGAEDCLEAVAATLSEWRGEATPVEAGRRRGYGLACACWLTMAGASGATLNLNGDGSVTLFTGSSEIGTGALVDGVRSLAADELGLSVDDVRLVSGDTDLVPFDVGSDGSRTLYGPGRATQNAAAEVRRILGDCVAEHFEADPRDIVFEQRRVGVAGSPEASVSFAEAVNLAVAQGGSVVASGRFQSPPVQHDASSTSRMFFTTLNEPTFHCHGAEIELDEDTGQITVVRYVAAHDVGTIVNPAGVKGQIEGGVVQGIGYAIYEEMQIGKDGVTRNADLHDYRMPTTADIPREITILAIQNHPSASGPNGAKGVGEGPVILPAAAIGAAFRDATGLHVTKLPLTPENILERMS
jgi:CO/xanthine dehydrogenase Mo-binding subunit